MPKGKYERKPGNKSKAQLAGNLPPKKYGKVGYGTKQATLQKGPRQEANGGDKNQTRSIWLKQLVDIGYGMISVAPNYGVQSILSLIPKEIHHVILELNRRLPNEAFSPIVYLGFSSWFEVFLKLDELKMKVSDCVPVIEQIFIDTQDILADRTDLDDLLALEFKVGVTFLEKENKLTDLTFEEDRKKENLVVAAVDGLATNSFGKFIPQEDIELMKKEKEASLGCGKQEELVRLTLTNCMRFSILSEMAVEWLGEEFQQALWRSQNYGTLAPISIKAWRLIAGISDSQMEEVTYAANNLVKLMDKAEICFPCATDLFDKKCQNFSGVTLSVKAHMAYPDIERSYSYLHRMWRCFSPYIKCNCGDSCKDSITWFDQAIWYVFNHLELVYPKYSQAGRMGSFLIFIQQNLKRAVMTHVAYMLVRDMMIKVTNKLASNPLCDLKVCFGETKLVEVCEMMIKNRNFMLEKLNQGKEEGTTAIPAYSGLTQSESYLPPRVARQNAESSCKIVENLADDSVSMIGCTPGEASVSKAEKPGSFFKASDLMQGRILY